MRIVIRIGGSVVASPIDPQLISKYTDLIQTLSAKNHEVVVVTGGGALARDFIQVARILGLDMQAQDEVAISVSRLFAQLFVKKLGAIAYPMVAFTFDDVDVGLKTGKIV